MWHRLSCRFAQKECQFAFNSGLFYVAANLRTIELMERLETRLSREKYWDQTAYNEEIFFLSHGKYKSPKVCVSGKVWCVVQCCTHLVPLFGACGAFC
jgi:hypothetical protein